MKNDHDVRDVEVSLALPVADGTVAGEVLEVGSLRVLALTPQVTQEQLDSLDERNQPAQGLEAGQASCVILGCHRSMWVDCTTAVDVGAPVYKQADKTYAATPVSGDFPAGYALGTLAAAGRVPIALFGTVPEAAA
jgi:hypothetical protein